MNMETIKHHLMVAIKIIKCAPSQEYQKQCDAIARVNRKVTALEFKTKPLSETHI